MSYLPPLQASPASGHQASPFPLPQAKYSWRPLRLRPPASYGFHRSASPSSHYPIPVPSAVCPPWPSCAHPARCESFQLHGEPVFPSAAERSVPPSSTQVPSNPVAESALHTISICLSPAALSWKADNSSPAARNNRRQRLCAHSSQTRHPASTALHPICCTRDSAPPAVPVFLPPPVCRPSRNNNRRSGIAPPPALLAPRATSAPPSAPADLSDTSAGTSETLLPPASRACCRGPPWPFRCSWPSPLASARRPLPAGKGRRR